jgi:hypothetical protein
LIQQTGKGWILPEIFQREHGLKVLPTTLLWGLMESPAGAQVMDIRPDGIATYSGSVIASPDPLPSYAALGRTAIDRAAVANLRTC